MTQGLCLGDVDLEGSYSAIQSFIEEYSRKSLSRIDRTLNFLTHYDCDLNSYIFNSGVAREIIEICGEDVLLSGEILMYIIVDHLYSNILNEAIIISTNGSLNEYKLYEICYNYLTGHGLTRNVENEISSILKRLYIISCVSCADLMDILDHIVELKYKPKVQSTSVTTVLSLMVIHSLTSLLGITDLKSTKRNSALLAIKLRNASIAANCNIIISNSQTSLTPSDVGGANLIFKIIQGDPFDPCQEIETPVFSKFSSKWHSSVDTKIHLKIYSQEDGMIKFIVSIIKSKTRDSGRSFHLKLTLDGLRNLND